MSAEAEKRAHRAIKLCGPIKRTLAKEDMATRATVIAALVGWFVTDVHPDQRAKVIEGMVMAARLGPKMLNPEEPA